MNKRKKDALIQTALRGTKEEQAIAKKILKSKGIEIELETEHDYIHKYNGEYQERLLRQIIVMVCPNCQMFKLKNRRNITGVTTTISRNNDIELMYSVYKRKLNEEIDITLRAFVQSNNIFPPSDDGKTFEDRELTDVEKKALSRAKEIDKTNIRKQLIR